MRNISVPGSITIFRVVFWFPRWECFIQEGQRFPGWPPWIRGQVCPSWKWKHKLNCCMCFLFIQNHLLYQFFPISLQIVCWWGTLIAPEQVLWAQLNSSYLTPWWLQALLLQTTVNSFKPLTVMAATWAFSEMLLGDMCTKSAPNKG